MCVLTQLSVQCTYVNATEVSTAADVSGHGKMHCGMLSRPLPPGLQMKAMLCWQLLPFHWYQHRQIQRENYKFSHNPCHTHVVFTMCVFTNAAFLPASYLRSWSWEMHRGQLAIILVTSANTMAACTKAIFKLVVYSLLAPVSTRLSFARTLKM